MTNENDMNNLPAEAWEPLQQQERTGENQAPPASPSSRTAGGG